MRSLAVAQLILRAMLPQTLAETIIADLDEEFQTDILGSLGPKGAKLWYWREAFSLAHWYLLDRARRRCAPYFPRPSHSPRKKKQTTMARTGSFLESIVRDVYFGIRSLRRRPAFTIVAVATLGLGIGAATTMFSVVDGVLLRGLPFENSGRLVNAWITNSDWRDHPFFSDFWDKGPLGWADYERWRDDNTQFQSVAVHSEFTMTLTGLGDPDRISVGLANAGLFQTLGVNPVIGRGFLPGEDGATAERIALLSHPLWRTRFATDPDAVGKTLTLNGNNYTIIGVLPAGFRLRTLVLGNQGGDGERAVWIPLGQPDILGGLENLRMEGVGRLASGVSLEQAQAETANLFAGDQPESPLGARLVSRKEDVTGNHRTPLFLLFGAAAILLVAACTNVAMLAIGEATGRRLEMATRAALGAGISRILRQWLTESVLLGLLGGALGVLIAYVGTATLVSLGPPIPRLNDVHVSSRALFFACSAGVIAGALFGLAPSVLFARGAAALGVRGGGKHTTGSGRKLQKSVVTLEIALTTVLLVAGGLLARSLSNLFAVEPGLRVANLATFHVPLPGTRYQSDEDATDFFTTVHRQIEATPGVVNASATSTIPFGSAFAVETPVLWFQIVGRETAEDEPPPQGWLSTALPDYHETLGVPVFSGRGFTEADDANAPRVVLINEAMAFRYWPDESPIGATLRIGETESTVVGIVGDVRHGGLSLDIEPMIHLPHSQHPSQGMGYALSYVVRTAGEPLQLLPQIQQAVWAVDPDVPITRINTMESLVAESGSDERYRTLLMMVFAFAAVVVATGGVFSVTAQGVQRQTRELGIRMALGARAEKVLGMVLKGSLVTAVIGVGSGLLVALWTTRVLSNFLFGVESSDPLTYVLVGLLLTGVCLWASMLPARRASRVDPIEVLRTE